MTGQAIAEMVPQLSPAMMVGAEVSTLTCLPAARLAVTQAAVTGSTARSAGCWRRAGWWCWNAACSSDPTPLGTATRCTDARKLHIDLVEQGGVTLHDPLRNLLISLPCGVLDEQVVTVASGGAGGGPHDLVVDEIGLHDLCALVGNGLHCLNGRSRGNVDPGCEPEQRGHARARARPWLPSVAVTSVTGAERSRSSVRLLAGESKPLRWLSARFTAQDAPRILKAGKPRRRDSSLTNTAATPSSAASSGSSTSGVGR